MQYLRICTSSAFLTRPARTHADFALAAGGHFVVVDFDLHAHLDHRVAHAERMSWKASTGGTGK
jgi:hypothetical protein